MNLEEIQIFFFSGLWENVFSSTVTRKLVHCNFFVWKQKGTQRSASFSARAPVPHTSCICAHTSPPLNHLIHYYHVIAHFSEMSWMGGDTHMSFVITINVTERDCAEAKLCRWVTLSGFWFLPLSVDSLSIFLYSPCKWVLISYSKTCHCPASCMPTSVITRSHSSCLQIQLLTPQGIQAIALWRTNDALAKGKSTR